MLGYLVIKWHTATLRYVSCPFICQPLTQNLASSTIKKLSYISLKANYKLNMVTRSAGWRCTQLILLYKLCTVQNTGSQVNISKLEICSTARYPETINESSLDDSRVRWLKYIQLILLYKLCTVQNTGSQVNISKLEICSTARYPETINESSWDDSHVRWLKYTIVPKTDTISVQPVIWITQQMTAATEVPTYQKCTLLDTQHQYECEENVIILIRTSLKSGNMLTGRSSNLQQCLFISLRVINV